jgi:hypothetical protein
MRVKICQVSCTVRCDNGILQRCHLYGSISYATHKCVSIRQRRFSAFALRVIYTFALQLLASVQTILPRRECSSHVVHVYDQLQLIAYRLWKQRKCEAVQEHKLYTTRSCGRTADLQLLCS